MPDFHCRKLLGLLLYPKATWLFAFAVLGVLLIVLNGLLAKATTPAELADWIERLVEGRTWGCDVDDFQGLSIRDAYLLQARKRCYETAGPPEVWAGAMDEKKAALRAIIAELRQRQG